MCILARIDENTTLGYVVGYFLAYVAVGVVIGAFLGHLIQRVG